MVKISFVVGLFIATFSCLCGCSATSATPHSPTTAPRHDYIGLDTSGGYRPHLPLSARLAAQVGTLHDPDRDYLSLYRLDSQCHEFYDTHPPDSQYDLQDILIKELKSSAQRPGTFPALFWSMVAASAHDDHGPVTIWLFSDGDNDDQSSEAIQEIRNSVLDLSKNPNIVSVAIVGASPSNWQVLKSEFKPLGSRFHICDTVSMNTDLIDSFVQQ